MDLSHAVAKLRPTQTVVKAQTVAEERPGKALLQFWCEDARFTLGSKECLEARSKYFATNLDVVIERIPAEFIVPAVSKKLSFQECNLIAGLWGTHTSAFLLPELESFVNFHINKYGGRGFVKLGCRSAKDVFRPQLYGLYKTYLSAQSGDVPRWKKLELLYRAQIDSLCVSSFQEALNLFSESTRVLFDLELDMLVQQDLHTTIVVRPFFIQSLSSEWRCFVRKREMICITQYFTDLFFPELVEIKEVIAKKILSVWGKIRDTLSLEDCVVDFFCDENTVLVLEVNQYARTTGSGLFTWDEIESKGCTLTLFDLILTLLHKKMTHSQ